MTTCWACDTELRSEWKFCVQCGVPVENPAGGPETKGKRAPMTEEQTKLMKEMVAKYDEDKNGRLSPEERAKISKEDKEKMDKAGIPAAGKGKKKKAE